MWAQTHNIADSTILLVNDWGLLEPTTVIPRACKYILPSLGKV